VIEIVTKKRLIDLDTPADSGSKRTKTASGASASAAAAPVAPATSKRRVATMNFVKQEVCFGVFDCALLFVAKICAEDGPVFRYF